MPSPNIVKQYKPQTFYHVYNQGADGEQIFGDNQDYEVFLNFLAAYLTPQDNVYKPGQRNYRDMSRHLQLVGYCLMPDHYHLLFYQQEYDAIARLMKRVMTGYSMYYNRRWYRSGRLFGSIYKAAGLEGSEDLMHTSRYLHLHPDGAATNPIEYPHSSYGHYVRGTVPAWVHPGQVLNLFASLADYRRFVTDFEVDEPEGFERLRMDSCKSSPLPPPQPENVAPSLGLQFD